MTFVVEHSLTCPHCWETITVTVDTSVDSQEYVEDCPVCCRPSVIRYTAAAGEVVDLQISPETE